MISKRNILDLKQRRDIYQFISKNPGLNTSEISQRINITRSTLRYHLKYLRRLNVITYKVYRRFKRFYACDRVGTKDQELLSLLRHKTPFRIIMYLLCPGFCSKIELARELKLHPTTIDFHIKKLLDMDIIRPAEGKNGIYISSFKHKPIVFKKPKGRETFYILKNQEIINELCRLLMTHKDSMIDPSIIDTLNEYMEEWKQICGPSKPKKYFSFNSTVDNLINILEEIAHFPYHF